MEQKQEQSAFTLTNNEEEEILSGANCPCCNYPLVVEEGLEVCYNCGWSADNEI